MENDDKNLKPEEESEKRKEIYEDMLHCLRQMEFYKINKIGVKNKIDWSKIYQDLKQAIAEKKLFTREMVDFILENMTKLLTDALGEKYANSEIIDEWKTKFFLRVCPLCKTEKLSYEKGKCFCKSCNSLFKVEKINGEFSYKRYKI